VGVEGKCVEHRGEERISCRGTGSKTWQEGSRQTREGDWTPTPHLGSKRTWWPRESRCDPQTHTMEEKGRDPSSRRCKWSFIACVTPNARGPSLRFRPRPPSQTLSWLPPNHAHSRQGSLLGRNNALTCAAAYDRAYLKKLFQPRVLVEAWANTRVMREEITRREAKGKKYVLQRRIDAFPQLSTAAKLVLYFYYCTLGMVSVHAARAWFTLTAFILGHRNLEHPI